MKSIAQQHNSKILDTKQIRDIMKYFELKCKTFIKKDIEFQKSFEIISKYISFCVCQIECYKKIHQDNGFKNYCFSGFYPIEKEKIYKNGQNYEFSLRSLDEQLIDHLQTLLRENINHSHIQVLQTTKSYKNQFFISELYSINPVIVSTRNDDYKTLFWTLQKDSDILKLQKQLHDNLEKKYQNFYNKPIKSEQNFIQLLEIKNKAPQTIPITRNKKTIRLFGNKFRIIPNEDKISQKLAFMALASGLGEKNSFGGGFMLGKGMRL